MSSFYSDCNKKHGENLIRFSIARKEEELIEAIKRISNKN